MRRYQEEMDALEKARLARKKNAGRQNGMLACERESPTTKKQRKAEEAEEEARKEEARKEGPQFPMEDLLLLQRERAHRQAQRPSTAAPAHRVGGALR